MQQQAHVRGSSTALPSWGLGEEGLVAHIEESRPRKLAAMRTVATDDGGRCATCSSMRPSTGSNNQWPEEQALTSPRSVGGKWRNARMGRLWTCTPNPSAHAENPSCHLRRRGALPSSPRSAPRPKPMRLRRDRAVEVPCAMATTSRKRHRGTGIDMAWIGGYLPERLISELRSC